MIVFRTPLDIEEIGANEGDFIVLDPSDVEFPVSVVRSVPPEAIGVIARVLPLLTRVDVPADDPDLDIDFATEALMRRLSIATEDPQSETDPQS